MYSFSIQCRFNKSRFNEFIPWIPTCNQLTWCTLATFSYHPSFITYHLFSWISLKGFIPALKYAEHWQLTNANDSYHPFLITHFTTLSPYHLFLYILLKVFVPALNYENNRPLTNANAEPLSPTSFPYHPFLITHFTTLSPYHFFLYIV